MQSFSDGSPMNLMATALQKRGYSVTSRLLGEKEYRVFTAPDGRVWASPVTAAFYPFVSAISKRISIDKQVAYAYAAMLGVTVPQTLRLPVENEVLDAFLYNYSPLVVKPLNLHGGKGVTLGITDRESLQAALHQNENKNSIMLLQQQAAGEEVRFTILNGEIAAVLLRQTPRVVGDGRSTVSQLIKAENKIRQHLSFEYLDYPQLVEGLVILGDAEGKRVPGSGEVVELSRSTMIRGGASVYNVTNTVHHSYKQTALRLARSLNPDFLVVDMMIQDYTQAQSDKNYVFIEFNTAPSLRLFYSVRDGKHYDIATKLAEMIETRMQ